jgi:integrase
MRRLTDTALKAELKKERAIQEELPDGSVPGLTVRVGGGSAATWSLVIRVAGEGGISHRGHALKGRRRRLTLGTYPAMGIETARARAHEYRALAEKGESPANSLERAATAGGLTVEALAQRFLEDYARSKELRSARKYEQAIVTHINPHIGGVLVDVLDREQVRELIRKVRIRRPRTDGARGRPRGGSEAARTVIAVLRLVLAWAIRENLVKRADNPASGMDKNLPKKRKKDRVLSLDEARIVWRAAGSAGYAFGTHVQLMLLTACRAGEWARSVWSWVDLKQKLLVIPAEAYKTNHVHVIPLVPEAMAILKNVPKGRSGEYILSSTDGAKPVWGIGKFYRTRLPREIIAHTGSALSSPFTSHDLRRTVATRLGESLGVGGEQLIRRVLGHSDGSVTAIYNRYGYVKEMRAGLEQWARELTR